MTEFLKFFDAYSIRARLFPALIAAAPALAALALLIPWKSFALSNFIAATGMLMLLFAIADFARARGRAIEDKLYAEHGGMPSILMLRRNDDTIDAGSKERYRVFLEAKLSAVAPDAETESGDQAVADVFYSQCGNWLRHNTRDTKKFSLLFGENVTYGFRRNLLGVKPLSLCVNGLVVVLCVLLLWRQGWNIDNSQVSRIAVVLLVAGAHAAYMILAVSRAAVWDAARAYGRELVLSCEAFLMGSAKPARKTAQRKSATKQGKVESPLGD